MSLLAGIKFVPKEQRSSKSIDKSGRKRHKKEKKAHKHEKRKRYSDSDSSSESSESDEDGNRRVKRGHSDRYDVDRHSERPLNDDYDDDNHRHKSGRYEHRRRSPSSSRELKLDESDYQMLRESARESLTSQSASSSSVATKSFDPSKFRSLLAGLAGKAVEPNTTEESPQVPIDLSTDVTARSIEKPSENVILSTAAPSSSTTASESGPKTNHNVAALMRQRLLAGKSLAGMNIPTLNQPNPASAGKDFDETLARQSLIYHAQQRQQLQVSATTGSKKGKSSDATGTDVPSNVSIHTLMQQEKFADDADMDRVFTDNVLRMGSRYTGKQDVTSTGDKAGNDEEAYIDMSMYQRHQSKDGGNEIQRMLQQAQQVKKQQERLHKAWENCRICHGLASSSLEICRGDHLVLRLKSGPFRLHPFHCELVPLRHCPSMLLGATSSSSGSSSSSANRIDEGVESLWQEIHRFTGCLRSMLAAEELRLVVAESAAHRGPSDVHAHTLLDLIPVPSDAVDEVIMSFQAAFHSAGSEWATHRKTITLNAQKPLYRAVPKHFPYYYVEWDEHEGMVHPIDQDASAQQDEETATGGGSSGGGGGKGGNRAGFFCYDVVAGALEEDEARLRRHRPPEDNQRVRAAVERFKMKWSVYDWTQHLQHVDEMSR